MTLVNTSDNTLYFLTKWFKDPFLVVGGFFYLSSIIFFNYQNEYILN